MAKEIMFLILLIILLSVLAVPVSAANPIDVGAEMISKGIDSWLNGMADKIMGASNLQNETAPNRVVFSILTYNPDPFSNSWVIESRNTTALVYMVLVFVFMLTGAAYVYLHTASPSMAKNIDFLVGGNMKYFHLQNYLKNLVLSIVFVAVTYTGYWLLLLFNQLMSELVLSYTLDSIIPKPDNFVLYIAMAISAFFLSIFMAWRVIVIGLGAAYIMLLAGLYLFNSTRQIAVKAFMYIVVIIFMQVILLTIAGGGVMVIHYIPLPESALVIYYDALTIGLFFIALLLTVGSTIILFFMRQGANVVKLVV